MKVKIADLTQVITKAPPRLLYAIKGLILSPAGAGAIPDEGLAPVIRYRKGSVYLVRHSGGPPVYCGGAVCLGALWCGYRRTDEG